MKRCKDCKWWYGTSWTKNVLLKGHCRRKPPEVFIIGLTRKDVKSMWPVTLAEHWCGEFESKTREPNEAM